MPIGEWYSRVSNRNPEHGVFPIVLPGSTKAFNLPTDVDFDAMKPGQLTHQLKQAVSKPGHVNKLYYWFVNLKVNSCYKTALFGWHPINIVCKAIWSQ